MLSFRQSLFLALTLAVAAEFPAGGAESENHGAQGPILVVNDAHPDASDSNPGSAEKPFRSIRKAVSAATPGTTILVHGGTYREEVELMRSGTADKRIILKPAPGERVIVSGADELKGWRKCNQKELRGNPNFDKIYCLESDWRPVRIFVAGNPEGVRLARWPKGDPHRPQQFSYAIESGDRLKISDSQHLNQADGFWNGATLGVYHEANDSVLAGTITSFDSTKHQIVVDAPRRYPPEIGKDRYYIENAPGTISEPGEYAIEASQSRYRIYFWPLSEGNPDNHDVEGSRRNHAIYLNGASYITVEGIEAVRTYGTGIEFSNGQSNEAIRCLAYYCEEAARMRAAFGFVLAAQTNSRIHNCISILNGYGINVAGSTNCEISENLAGANTVDAMIACWHSHDIQFVRNCVIDNWYRKHPDGFQTYRDVQRLRLDSNLFLNVGQGWQCAETQDAIVTNNIWAGIHYGNSISCSLRRAVVGDQNLRNIFVNNTFFGGNVSSGGESRFINNIAWPPSFGGTEGGPPLESDYNLVWSDSDFKFRWNKPGQKRQQRGTFSEWQQATGLNPHSHHANPQFRNAPAFERHLETVPNTNRSRLYLRRGDVNGFQRGDLIELDCDGVRRTVVAVKDDYLIVDPPWDVAPDGSLSFVWNWKDNTNFSLDFRPGEKSPARGHGKAGADIGSSIDIQA
ncbi:MAG TPA: right-handed parallel beta-helix repeat-containing protein, partial [Verrucomicrobiae bacterium]|nr:right-handed parallel beta-helix repeat-containing protein [Verrucomicrobiae bacterium]